MTNYTTAAGVQQFSITIASGSTTGTVNLATAVGTGAFITDGGSNPSVTTDFAEAGAYLSWSTTAGVTTIVATRTTGTTGTVVRTGSMTDPDTSNLVVGVQQGTVSVTAGTSNTASVTAPGSDANTALHHLGTSGTGTTLSASVDYGVLTQSASVVTVTFPAAGTTVTGFCLIEFQAAALDTPAVQRISATSSSSVTSFTASLGTNVTLARAITFWAGKSIATVTTNDAESLMRGALTAVGTFTVTVNTAVADAKTYNASIVALATGVLNSSVQRGTTTLTGATSNTSILTAVNETYSGVSWLGNSTTAGTALLNESTGAAQLTTAAPGTPTVRHISSSELSPSSSPAALSITSTTAGDLLVVAISASGSGGAISITGVSDTTNGSWTNAGANGTVTSGLTSVYYFPNTAAAVTSISVAYTGTLSILYPVVYQVSNMALATPVDTVAHLSSQPSSATQVSSPINTAAANDFIAVISSSFFGGGSYSSPYTGDGDINTSGYYIPSTTVSSNSATFTAGAPSTYCMSTAAFLANTATSDVVNVTKATATANITGSWEVFEFPAFSGSPNATANPTGAVGTGHAGTAIASISVIPSGVSATGSAGTPTPQIGPAVTGVTATGSVGTPVAQYGSNISITGVSGSGVAGTVIAANNNLPTGVSGTCSGGTVSPAESSGPLGCIGTGHSGSGTPQIQPSFTGVSGTGSVGTVTVTTGGSPDATVNIIGVFGTGIVGFGQIGITPSSSGVAGTGAVGSEIAANNNTPSGISGAGQCGSGHIEIDVSLSGAHGAGFAGTGTTSIAGNISGISCTGLVGSASVTITYHLVSQGKTVYLVPAENRVLVIETESRDLIIEAESREYDVPLENRTLDVPLENRIITVLAA